MHILTNPELCFLAFLDTACEHDRDQKERKLLHWIKVQTPFQTDQRYVDILTALGLGNALVPSYLGCLDAFTAMGWVVTGSVAPQLLTKAVPLLLSSNLIEVSRDYENFDRKEFAISRLGIDLVNAGVVNQYLDSLAEVTAWWKGSVFKLFREGHPGLGSGFAISPDTIVTCRHVISEWEQEEIIIEDISGNRHQVTSMYLHAQETHDLAILKLTPNTTVRPMLKGARPRELDPVIILGYPPVPLVDEAILLANRGEISAVTNRRYGGDRNLPRSWTLILSSLLRPGNSGGPVLDKHGKVVGVVSRNLYEQTLHTIDANQALGMSAAVSIEHLEEINTE